MSDGPKELYCQFFDIDNLEKGNRSRQDEQLRARSRNAGPTRNPFQPTPYRARAQLHLGHTRILPSMGRQIRPAKVYQMVTAELQSRVMPKYEVKPPPWYPVLYNIPPAETITRTPAVQLREVNKKQKRPRNVYRPQRIVFPEDALRQTFYKDHPWELARPRMILELDGKDSRLLDWSKGVRQPGMALSGEWYVD